jgi:hypothetical protein
MATSGTLMAAGQVDVQLTGQEYGRRVTAKSLPTQLTLTLTN